MSQSANFQSCWDRSFWVEPTKQRIKCLAQGHNTVPLVRLEPATPRSQIKHSFTEPPHSCLLYSKTGLKRPLKRRLKIVFQDRLLLNAGQKYCRMLQGEQESILQYFRPSLSYHLSLRSLLCLFLSGNPKHTDSYKQKKCFPLPKTTFFCSSK